jgi:hypothetical protein
MGLYGGPFFPCWKTGHLPQKWDNSIKNGTSGHPGIVQSPYNENL